MELALLIKNNFLEFFLVKNIYPFKYYVCIFFFLQDKYSQNPKELIRVIKKCLESESLLVQNNVCIRNVYYCIEERK